MKSISFMLLSPLLIAACSSSGGSNGPSVPSVDDKARGSHFSQAVVDDLKAAQAKSSAVLPDMTLLTGAKDDERKKSEDKLNADGRAWLSKMQQNCSAQTSGSAPTSGKGTGVTVQTVSGTECPIQARTTTTQTNNMDSNGGSVDSKVEANERVVNTELAQESGTLGMDTLLNVHADISKENVHVLENGTITVALTNSNIRMSIDADIAKTKDAMNMAIAVGITTEKGQLDLGLVLSNNAPHYYIGGREVTAQEFQDIFGSSSPVGSLGLTSKALTSR